MAILAKREDNNIANENNGNHNAAPAERKYYSGSKNSKHMVTALIDVVQHWYGNYGSVRLDK